MKHPFFSILVVSLLLSGAAYSNDLPQVRNVEAQPLLAQALRLDDALTFLGSSLSAEDSRRLQALRDEVPGSKTTRSIQQILDPYCLAMVVINPEARVKVLHGPAQPVLVQNGWKSFLVKVHNQAMVTTQLEAESPNAEPILHRSTNAKRAKPENLLSAGEVANRFLELYMYRRRPLLSNLSGVELEYAVIQIYTRDTGRREAKIGFHVGQGTQDIGFRSTIDILFDCQAATKVVFRIKDHDGSPAPMASLVITDGIERIVEGSDPMRISRTAPSGRPPLPKDYRLALAARRTWEERGTADLPASSKAKRLTGIRPLPSRRLAAVDEFPDFFFHPQIYRADGEHVFLPAGEYEVTLTRGPEYLPQTKRIQVPSGKRVHEVQLQLTRWVHMAKLGWYSADHHVHAAGCSHYESPEEGVRPEHMWRQAQGEDLNIACNLTWGPCWYYQKSYFTGKVHPLSNRQNLLRYDVEVSGFPSSHAGHVCLLRLKEDDFPGTSKVEEWPTWTLPILQWAKQQDAVVGYAHSGWGLEPMEPTDTLPNYVLPKFDGIGANEYIVTVTQDAVDFFSAGDTPAPWELNIWYHVLNSGFRTRLSGETDFPCIFDDRVGMARSYAKLDGPLNFDRYMDQIRAGRSYVSDGASHIVDFSANGLELGTQESELNLPGTQTVEIRSRVIAYLPIRQDEVGAIVASRRIDRPPYWHIERARLGKTRQVPVELIVNGEPVAKKMVEADGQWREVSFTHPVKKSSWLALRIYPSSHTNPIFVQVDGKPVRASRRSAEWCRRAVDQCWKMKSPRIRPEEREQAAAAYERARLVYDRIVRESRP